MTVLLKSFNKGKIEFRHGRFDKWAVVVTVDGKKPIYPKDKDYFTFLSIMGKTYGNKKVYQDFIEVYEMTSRDIDHNIIERITDIAKSYKGFEHPMDIVMSVIYFTLIAEENKAFSMLGKRIKRLGIHQMLVEGLPVEYVANFSRGKKWRELDTLCIERGF